MNKERIEALAQAIEKASHFKLEEHLDSIAGEDRVDDDLIGDNPVASRSWRETCEGGVPLMFNMGDFSAEVEGCGTVGCIAGFCVALFPIKEEDFKPYVADFVRAVHLKLEIPRAVANYLCMPAGIDYYAEATPQQAAQAVRNLLDEEVLFEIKHPWHHLGAKILEPFEENE